MGKNYGAVDHLNMTGSGRPLGTNFYCVRCVPTRAKESANETNQVGEYDPDTHHSFNEVIRYEAEYVSKVRTEISAIEITTGSGDAMAVESVVLQQENKKYARIRMTAHEHPEQNFGEHLDNERTITLPAFLGFGANDHLGVFESELDVQRSEYNITVGHEDDSNNVGEHLVGRSQGEMHRVTVEAITDELPDEPTAPWKTEDRQTPRLNNEQYRASITASKLVAGPV
ncbi:MAG TPA: hypothetical protein PKC67_02590 [Kiritimatiellia bacterium]|nr:hypothetical protein [Kiritimatiellia bacterium]HMP33214.1 hypothetical protein [Kiritimatiellia bacterium]